MSRFSLPALRAHFKKPNGQPIKPLQQPNATRVRTKVGSRRDAAEFENYARMWIPLVDKFGGKHLGYFLPHEGANNVALALFNFPSLAAYEEYRQRAATDPECQAAMAYYRETRCFVSFERSFMRPIFE